jgi:putative ABC transport system substrate-binding protein
VKRRTFIAALGGAAAWPVAARAQQPERVPRIGVLMNFIADAPESQPRTVAFAQGLRELGWLVGHNVQIDTRWAGDDPDRYHKYAAELVALTPDVILASASPSVAALQQLSRNVPIVFANVIDPVGAGFVASLPRPGGNTTGFTAFEYSLSGKWLELLREIVPNLARAAVLRNPALAAGIGQFAAIQSAASSSGVELSAIDLRDVGEIERGLAAFAREPKGGVVITADASAVIHRELIISLVMRHRLPNIYAFPDYALSGGLASYGPEPSDAYRRAAGYVDRILKGEKPANLPVQTPTKYSLVINLKAAKALGIDVPHSLLARADEVIE